MFAKCAWCHLTASQFVSLFLNETSNLGPDCLSLCNYFEICFCSGCGCCGSWKMLVCDYACESMSSQWFSVCMSTSLIVWNFWWETNFSQDSHIYTTVVISPTWISGWCVLPFSELGFYVWVCVCVCVEEENIIWLEPAASRVSLKFACFPPICNHKAKAKTTLNTAR